MEAHVSVAKGTMDCRGPPHTVLLLMFVAFECAPEAVMIRIRIQKKVVRAIVLFFLRLPEHLLIILML